MDSIKACAHCGETFRRRPHLSHAQWSGTKYCSRRCAARKATGQTLLERFFANVERDTSTSCWLWQASTDTAGYGLFSVDGRHVKAHRFLYEAMVSPIPDGQLALHRCDVRACVNPFHIFLGSHQDNIADAVLKNRMHAARGEQVHNARLTEAEVCAIRDDPRTQDQIARDYGIGQTTVSAIKTRRNWSHIQDDEIAEQILRSARG